MSNFVDFKIRANSVSGSEEPRFLPIFNHLPVHSITAPRHHSPRHSPQNSPHHSPQHKNFSAIICRGRSGNERIFEDSPSLLWCPPRNATTRSSCWSSRASGQKLRMSTKNSASWASEWTPFLAALEMPAVWALRRGRVGWFVSHENVVVRSFQRT